MEGSVVSAFRRTLAQVRLKPDTTDYTSSRLHVRQQPNQLCIGWREFERGEIVTRRPAQLLTDERPRLAEKFAANEVQLDPPFRIRVRRRVHLVADARVDAQLLPQLAPKAGAERLVGLAFAAGKLPEAFEVDALLPPGHQEPSVALDDGSGHDE